MTHSIRTSLLALLSISLLFVGAGCFIQVNPNGTAGSGADGGVFKTTNRGDQWAQKNSILSTGDKQSLNNVNVSTIVQDPQDANTMYVGTTDNGLFYSVDAGESWQQPKQITKSRVNGVAVSPKDTCTVFVAIENKLLKTTDCSRTWAVVFSDPRSDKRVNAVALESARPETVWIGLSTGDVIRSVDGGTAWTNVKNVGGVIVRLLVNNADNRKLLVATQKNGIFRSVNGGGAWEDLSKKYSSFAGSKDFTDIAVSASAPNTMVFASRFGLLRTKDGGDSWEPLGLLTQPGATLIYALAMDPKDSNVLYYGTNTTLYRTTDGGASWVPKKLPTTRAATVLKVDSAATSTVYMGTTKLK